MTTQRLAQSGRIRVSKKAWTIRTICVILMVGFFAFTVYEGTKWPDGDLFILSAILIPVHSLAYMVIGWYFYKSPTLSGIFYHPEPLVTVIIPVYNQKKLIADVIKSVFESTYKNIEVVAVDDGSTDGTREILAGLTSDLPRLKIINMPKNGGKRKAVAAGVHNSAGDYIVLIDSDSVIHNEAITEFMKAFYSDERIGALVGNAKVLNANKNFLTRCQDVWYDYSFNIRKSAESYFGSVMCCSGCLAAYRKKAIENYIPYWVSARLKDSEDRELTTFVIANKGMKKWLLKWGARRLKEMSQYDDAEDRGLTAQTIATEWKAVYVPSAVVYTDVPEKWSTFMKQQKRWKKGTLRVNMFVSLFFWRKNPILSILLFYVEFALMFISPALVIIAFVYEPIFLGNWLIPITFLIGSVAGSLVHGLDYRFRDNTSKTWYYKPFMNFLTGFIISWIVFPAIFSFRKNEWGTR